MNDNIVKLLKLIQENPNLPIVPMVDREIAEGDECDYWLGKWGSATIDEYIVSRKYIWDSKILFKSDDDVFYVLGKCLTSDEFKELPETEDECRPIYNALPWTKAIIVYINR